MLLVSVGPATGFDETPHRQQPLPSWSRHISVCRWGYPGVPALPAHCTQYCAARSRGSLSEVACQLSMPLVDLVEKTYVANFPQKESGIWNKPEPEALIRQFKCRCFAEQPLRDGDCRSSHTVSSEVNTNTRPLFPAVLILSINPSAKGSREHNNLCTPYLISHAAHKVVG